MTPNIGLNVTCNTNCSHWCPRVLRIFCCCCKVDDEAVQKTHRIATKRIEEYKIEDNLENKSTPDQEVEIEGKEKD